jgi:hypothetical protein
VRKRDVAMKVSLYVYNAEIYRLLNYVSNVSCTGGH